MSSSNTGQLDRCGLTRERLQARPGRDRVSLVMDGTANWRVQCSPQSCRDLLTGSLQPKYSNTSQSMGQFGKKNTAQETVQRSLQ